MSNLTAIEFTSENAEALHEFIYRPTTEPPWHWCWRCGWPVASTYASYSRFFGVTDLSSCCGAKVMDAPR